MNTGDYDSRTALHLACAENNIDTIKWLIDHGADVKTIDRWGSI